MNKSGVFAALCVLVHASEGAPSKRPPSFDADYRVKGTLYMPYAEIAEPFEAWYSPRAGRSRIDYYNGMAKTYQWSNVGEYGTMFKVIPVTTETKFNKTVCWKVEGGEDSPVDMQSVLPDMTNYQYVGLDKVRGLKCDKWRLVDRQEDKINKYTVWVNVKESGDRAVPVRFEVRGRMPVMGSAHFDHYFLDYEAYEATTLDPADFAPPRDLACGDFPDGADRQRISFNPMREFVHGDEAHVQDEFHQFRKRHNASYSDHEHVMRREIFRQNLRFIHSKNRAVLGFSLAVNHLADRSAQELRALRGRRARAGARLAAASLPFPHATDETAQRGLPASLDWRLHGAVTPVKDQAVCGSCWSFGATGVIEGAYFLKYGKLPRLSQQALVDCSWGFENEGCDGGLDVQAYSWIMKHGLPTEDDYGPYLAQDGYCHIDKVKPAVTIKGWVNVTARDANALKVALAKEGPISVAIDASLKTFAFYANGIFYDETCRSEVNELDHAVLLVGYGTLGDRPYWLVKNSWSSYWGNDGYVLISPQNNDCGVATAPTYVVL